MHTVTCPRCNKILEVPKPVSNAKIRCTGCMTVFVGSSTPIASSPPASAGPPLSRPEPKAPVASRADEASRPRLYRGKQKRAPVPPAVVAVVGVGLLGIIILAVVLGHLAGESPDKKAADKGNPETQPSAAARTDGAGGGPGGRSADTRPGVRPGDGGRTDTSSRPAHPGGDLPKNDVLIKVNHRTRTDDYGNTTAYGEVRNTHTYPVRQVALRFIVRDADGKEMMAQAVCNHLPAMGTAGFAVRLGLLPEDASPTIIATSEREPKDVVCWHVDTSSVRLDAETVKGAIILNGRVANPTDTTVADVELHCDFFWRTGQYHSTVVGKLTKAFRIAPGKTEPYRVTLANVLAPSGISDETTLRLVGKAVR